MQLFAVQPGSKLFSESLLAKPINCHGDLTDLQKVKSPANPYRVYRSKFQYSFNQFGSFYDYVICPIDFQGKTHDSTLVFLILTC